MPRTIDLTGKLGLGERPTVTFDGNILTVDDAAENVVRVLEMAEKGLKTSDVLEAARLMFDAESAEKLEGLRLSFSDYAAVVSAAVELAMGGEGGKAETPATI